MLKGFSEEEIETSNLLDDERWEHRLLGPVRDHDGRICAFWSQDVSTESRPAGNFLVLVGTR